MNFNFGDDSVQSEGIKEFPVSRDFINNCFLTGVKYTKADNYTSLDFTFMYNGDEFPSKKGATWTHKEFDPSVKSPNATDEQHQKGMEWAAARLKHIFGKFIPDDVLKTLNFPDFASMAQAMEGSLMKYAQNKPCRLKTVYRNNYVAFPLFPSFISTELKPADLSWNPTYDKDQKENMGDSASGGSGSSAAPPPPPPPPPAPAHTAAPATGDANVAPQAPQQSSEAQAPAQAPAQQPAQEPNASISF